MPFWISLQNDVSVLSVALIAMAELLMLFWSVWHGYVDATAFSFAGAFVDQVQKEFERELLDERKLSFKRALVRYAEMERMSHSVVSKATSQITGWILLFLLCAMVALYDGLLMPWSHPCHVLMVCTLFMTFPMLVLPLIQIGGTFQANLLRRLAGCDGVGRPDGLAELWNAEERVLFIQHAQVLRVPMTLVGVEINQKMLGFLLAGAISAITAFWDYSSNRGFEGFAFDLH